MMRQANAVATRYSDNHHRPGREIAWTPLIRAVVGDSGIQSRRYIGPPVWLDPGRGVTSVEEHPRPHERGAAPTPAASRYSRPAVPVDTER